MSKRFKERQPEPQVSTRRPSVPPETAAQLFHVGARARKHVSEGHLTSGQSHYSYKPVVEQPAPPIYDRGEFKDLRQKSDLQIRSQKQPIKRQLEDEDEDATDVDEDEDDLPQKPKSMTEIKAFFVPSNYKAEQEARMEDDFEDVSFLRPQE